VLFDVPTARRALVYISRVARDASRAYAQTQECRFALEIETNAQIRAELAATRDAALRRLNGAIDECNVVGVDLLDIATGTVRFTVESEGQRIFLDWKPGDCVETAWEAVLEPASA
jgi:hypothetical protein